MNIDYKYSFYPTDESLSWTLADSELEFKKNFKKYPDNKSLKYYLENPIEYKFNNCGFRTPDDFNEEDEGNVFLGDSNTMGVGHHLKNIWAYKINKDIGGKFWNLGQGGCGNQTDYRLLYGWKDTLKIKNIFHYSINHSRFEFFHNGELVHLSPYETLIQKNIPSERFYVEILSDTEYLNFIQDTYINAIKGLAKDIGCNYYYLKGNIFDGYDLSIDDSLEARDLLHDTVDQQNFLYEKFRELYVK